MELSCHQKGGGGGKSCTYLGKKGGEGCEGGAWQKEGGRGGGGDEEEGRGGLLVHLRWGCVLGKGMKTGFETQNNIL